MTKLTFLNRTFFTAAILFVVVVLISCSNDEPKADPNPPAVSDPPPCLIQQFKSIWAVNTIFQADTFTYSYDKYGRITSARHGQTFSSTGPYQYEEFTYTYVKDRLPSKIASRNLSFEFQYDEQDRLVVRKALSLSGVLKDTLCYDESGRVVQLFRSSGGEYEKFDYKYEGSSNPYTVTDTLYRDNVVVSATYFEIASGTRVFLDLHLPVLIDVRRFDYTGFKNNINKIIRRSENGGELENIFFFKDNQYNQQTNYPITLKGTKSDGTYNESYKFLCQ